MQQEIPVWIGILAIIGGLAVVAGFVALIVHHYESLAEIKDYVKQLVEKHNAKRK